MAERLATMYAGQSGLPNFQASSAGTHAVVAHPIHRDAATVLEKMGADVSGFAARQLNRRIASDADLILTMTKAHRDAVLEVVPNKLFRTFTLSEAAQLASGFDAKKITDLAPLRPHLDSAQVVDVPDPIRESSEFFEIVGEQIKDLLGPIIALCQRG